jgi:hypothetical protein
MPFHFEIAASNAKEALDKFNTFAEKAIEDQNVRIKEMQEEMRNKIVTPEDSSGGGNIITP